MGGPGPFSRPVGKPAGGPVIVAKPGGGPDMPAGIENPDGRPAIPVGMGIPDAPVMVADAAVRIDVPTEAAAAAASAVMRERISGGGPLPSVGIEKPAGGPFAAARASKGRRGIARKSVDEGRVAMGAREEWLPTATL